MKPKTAQGGNKPIKSQNVTHKNTVHNENIKKENRYAGKNLMENYQLNPNSMVLLTDKPNHVVPSRPGTTQVNSNKDDIFGNHFTEDPVEEAFSNEKLEKTLKLITLVPKQKYTIPQTSNQEIGWFSNQLTIAPSKWDHKMKQNEITKFANDYLELTKKSPFTLK